MKAKKMINESTWYWLVATLIFNFLRLSNNFTTDKPSELSFVLKEYNPLLACLSVPFTIYLVVKLIEVFLIRLKPEETVPEGKSVLLWLIKHFHISYRADQLVLKDETLLLVFQFLLCFFGFFIELKWYLIGSIGLFFYLCLYIALSYQAIKTFFRKNL